MTWVRLADDFYQHPKVLQSGPLAGWLWVCGLAYANHYLTDGYLPRAAVRGLTDVDEPFRLAATLVESGLWDEAPGGFRIHDYDAYQPSAESIKAERAANAERVAEWRRRQRNGVTPEMSGRSNDVRNGVSPGTPVPGPGPGPVNPVPADTSSPLPPPPQAEEGEAIATITAEDCQLWKRALEHLPSMTPGNREQVHQLEPLGRAADGGLRLRAPPGHRLARFRPQIARALVDAGDAHGKAVQIVER